MDSLRGSFHRGLCRTSPFTSFVTFRCGAEDFVANTCPFAVIRGPILVRWTSSALFPKSPHWSRRTSDVKTLASCNIRNLKLCLLCQPTVKRFEAIAAQQVETMQRVMAFCRECPPHSTELRIIVQGLQRHRLAFSHLAGGGSAHRGTQSILHIAKIDPGGDHDSANNGRTTAALAQRLQKQCRIAC